MNGGWEEVRAGHGKHLDVPASPVSLPRPLFSLPHPPIPLRHSAISKESAAFRWRAMRPSVKPRPLSAGPHFFSRSISHSLGFLPPPESPHHLLPKPPATLARPLTATDPSGTAYPGIPERLCGIAGAGRDERENSFIFPSLGNSGKLLPPPLASLFPFVFFPDGEPLSRPS